MSLAAFFVFALCPWMGQNKLIPLSRFLLEWNLANENHAMLYFIVTRSMSSTRNIATSLLRTTGQTREEKMGKLNER
jgi:hypothetical protein